MKRYVLSLFCAGLAGLAWAADPPAAAPCSPKVCMPEPTTKKIDKVIYDEKCVDYCLPRAAPSGHFSAGTAAAAARVARPAEARGRGTSSSKGSCMKSVPT